MIRAADEWHAPSFMHSTRHPGITADLSVSRLQASRTTRSTSTAPLAAHSVAAVRRDSTRLRSSCLRVGIHRRRSVNWPDRRIARPTRLVGCVRLVGHCGRTDTEMALDPRQPNPVVDNSPAQTVDVVTQSVVILAVLTVRLLERRVVTTAHLVKRLAVLTVRVLKGFAVLTVGLVESPTMLGAGLAHLVADLLAAVLLMPDDPERSHHQRDQLKYGIRSHAQDATQPRTITQHETIKYIQKTPQALAQIFQQPPLAHPAPHVTQRLNCIH